MINSILNIMKLNKQGTEMTEMVKTNNNILMNTILVRCMINNRKGNIMATSLTYKHNISMMRNLISTNHLYRNQKGLKNNNNNNSSKPMLMIRLLTLNNRSKLYKTHHTINSNIIMKLTSHADRNNPIK